MPKPIRSYWAYGRLLDEPSMAEIVAKGQTRFQAALVPIVLPIARGAIRRGYRITPSTVLRSKGIVVEIFAELTARLEVGLMAS
jgi:hypothetical protein